MHLVVCSLYKMPRDTHLPCDDLFLADFIFSMACTKEHENHRWEEMIGELNSENQKKGTYLCHPIFVEAIIFYQETYETLERGQEQWVTFRMYE